MFWLASRLGGSLLALLWLAAPARAQAVEWAVVTGQSHNNGAPNWLTVSGIRVDAGFNAYLCGYFVDSMTIGAFTLYAPDSLNKRTGDGFVAKLDPNGQCVWAVSCGGQAVRGTSADGYGLISTLTLDPLGNPIIIGASNSYAMRFGPISLCNASDHTDLFVAKLNGTTRQWLWAKRLGGSDDESASSA